MVGKEGSWPGGEEESRKEKTPQPGKIGTGQVSTLLLGGGQTTRQWRLQVLVSNALKGEVAVNVTRTGIGAGAANPPQAHGTQLALEQRRGQGGKGEGQWGHTSQKAPPSTDNAGPPGTHREFDHGLPAGIWRLLGKRRQVGEALGDGGHPWALGSGDTHKQWWGLHGLLAVGASQGAPQPSAQHLEMDTGAEQGDLGPEDSPGPPPMPGAAARRLTFRMLPPDFFTISSSTMDCKQMLIMMACGHGHG